MEDGKYKKIIRFSLNIQRSEKNKMQATGSLVIQVLRHTVGITGWGRKAQKLHTRTKKC